MTDWFVGFGAFCFGAVIGWVTKEAMVRTDKLSISHIAVVIGTVGGAHSLAKRKKCVRHTIVVL